MLIYFLRRLLGIIPVLFIIITLAFFLLRAAPGGPFDEDRILPPEIEMRMNQHYGLDQPLSIQYVRYLSSLLMGDLGPSFKHRDFTVNELIEQGFPVSFRVGVLALILAVIAGVAIGVVAALKHNGALDHIVMGAAMTGIAVPNFVLAPLMALFFGVYLGWLPVAGWDGGGFRHLVLPVIALSLPYVAYLARLTRGSALEVLGSGFVRAARAKGLPRRLIVTRHVLRSALLPVVSFLGPAAAGIITGSLIIEEIFHLPGIGRYFVRGALNRDYTLVMGVVILYASLILLFNLLVDLFYRVLDPRVEYK